jgi:hypothetical protein
MKKITYSALNARQKENYNYQKIASDLAEYGYSCMWLNDDWQGADFIANHIDGKEFLRVQLKGRLTVNKKYLEKNLYIAFREHEQSYLYPHDILLHEVVKRIEKTKSWAKGGYSWPKIPTGLAETVKKYQI